ncbi:MAG: hypothetical protein ABJN69_17675 [Hellea sp.]
MNIIKIPIIFITMITTGGCTGLYKKQEKVCIDTQAHEFTEVRITSCGRSFPLKKISNNIWSTDGAIRLGNCEIVDILGIGSSGEDIEISRLYHFSQIGLGVTHTTRYEITDLNAEKPWDRVEITGLVDGKNLQCDADMPLPDYLKKHISRNDR